MHHRPYQQPPMLTFAGRPTGRFLSSLGRDPRRAGRYLAASPTHYACCPRLSVWFSSASSVGKPPPPSMSTQGKMAAGRGKAASGHSRASNTCAHVQILGAGGDIGGVPSAMLFFDHARIVFNLPEGFQRYAAENKLKLNKISAAMFTRTSMETAGGLPGMVLSAQDQEENLELALYGHSRLESLVQAMHTFISSSHLDKIGKHMFRETPVEPIYEDSAVSIRSVVVHPSSATETGNSSSSFYHASTGGEAKRHKSLHSCQSSKHADPGPVVCYFAKLADTPGKFMPEKAIALKVPKGPMFAQLVRGESVTSSDGNIVRPDQVLGPGVPGATVVIVDCPTLNYLEPVIEKLSTTFSNLGSQPADSTVAVCIVHLSPQQVVSHPKYRDWMASMGANTTHIITSECSGETVLFSAAKLQKRLHSIDGEVFPLHSTKQSGGVLQSGSIPNCVPGRNRLKFHLRPASRVGIDDSDVPVLAEGNLVADEVFEQLIKKAEATQLETIAPPSLAGLSRSECEITLLGTGSSIPSKYRNVTGIYVNLFAAGGMMLDCGEDSYGQMVRRFGVEGAERAVSGLKLIWISHIHADHHVGLARLLNIRQRVLGSACEPVLLVGPKPLKGVLQSLNNLEALSYEWIDGINLQSPSQRPEWLTVEPSVSALVKTTLDSLGLESLFNVRAVHCAHSWGVVFQSKQGWKVMFSGDTRPCIEMINAAKDADLLIHEATFDDDMPGEAIAKRHSMTREAVSVGADAGVFRTLLTHFSQRYPKIPVIAPSFKDSTCIAFDLMSVNLADITRLPSYVPVLEHLFKETTE